MRVKWELENPWWAKCTKLPNQISCGVCEESFSSRDNLRSHVVEHNLHHGQSCKLLRLDLDRLTDVLKIVQDPDNSLFLDLLHFICDIVEPPPCHLATSLERCETLIALACPCLEIQS